MLWKKSTWCKETNGFDGHPQQEHLQGNLIDRTFSFHCFGWHGVGRRSCWKFSWEHVKGRCHVGNWIPNSGEKLVWESATQKKTGALIRGPRRGHLGTMCTTTEACTLGCPYGALLDRKPLEKAGQLHLGVVDVQIQKSEKQFTAPRTLTPTSFFPHKPSRLSVGQWVD